MPNFLHRLRRVQAAQSGAFWSDTQGVTAIEFGLIAPVLLALLANLIDLSFFVYSRQQVDVAAQQGSRAVLVACEAIAEFPVKTRCAKFSTAVQQAINSTNLGTAVTWVQDANDEGYWCPNPTTGQLTRVGGLTSAPPPTTCAQPGVYIRVKATYAFKPFFGDLSAIGHLATLTITREAYTRLL